MAEEWRIDYNTERPHKALGYLSPGKYAERFYQDYCMRSFNPQWLSFRGSLHLLSNIVADDHKIALISADLWHSIMEERLMKEVVKRG